MLKWKNKKNSRRKRAVMEFALHAKSGGLCDSPFFLWGREKNGERGMETGKGGK